MTFKPIASILGTALVVVALAAMSTPSVADHFSGPSGGGSNPCSTFGRVNAVDGGTTKWRLQQPFDSAMEGAIRSTITYEFEPTNLDFVEVSPTAHTDIRYTDKDYSGACGYTWHATGTGQGASGVIGLYNCFKLQENPGVFFNSCDKSIIRLDTSWFTIVGSLERVFLACHETGHAVGLKHQSADCLKNTKFPTINTLGTHSEDEINGFY